MDATSTRTAAPAAPVMTRNDWMLSFHFLNYGPDPHTMPESAFAAKWEGFLTPDATVDAALFQIVGRGNFNASLTMRGKQVLSWVNGQPSKTPTLVTTSLTKGVKVPFVFTFAQHDATGSHPAFALQWSLQGSSAHADALAAVKDADAVVVVVGGGTSVTSGEGEGNTFIFYY